MILILKFEDLPPMPRNRSHMLTSVKGRPMNIKTPLCREFEKDVLSRMNEFKAQTIKFEELFDSKKNYISAEYYIFTPKDSLYTLEKKISAKAVDLDAHKTLQDTIFKYIGLDDKLVRDVRYFSPVSHDGKWNFIIVYRLENLCNLEGTSTSIQSLTPLMNDDSMLSALL
jgi:hypothetical protein